MKSVSKILLCLSLLCGSAVCQQPAPPPPASFPISGDLQLVVQTGHSQGVNSIAFSPDGKTLASGSSDNTIKLWEVATGRELRTFSGHLRFVTAVVFTDDGKTLASASWDKTVRLWDAGTGKELRTLTGHSSFIDALAFTSDGRKLASGSDDKTIKLWDVATGNELRTLTGHSSLITSLAFSGDGKTLASGSGDKTVKLWEVATGRELQMLTGHSQFVTCVAFSADGKTVASGSRDQTIKLWEASTGRELRTLSGHSGFIRSVAFSPNAQTLASGSEDRTIKLWDVTTGRELAKLTGHFRAVTTVAFSADGKTLASGSFDKTIKLWEVGTNHDLRTLAGHASSISSVAFSADGKTLASAGADKTIKLWAAAGRELRTLGGDVEFAASDRRVDRGDCLAFSPDGKTLASGREDKTIKLWEVATGRELRTLSGHSGNVLSIAFSADGKTLASGSDDKTARLWEVDTGRELQTFSGHSNSVTSVALSKDGKTLASGSRDQTIKLWDVATRRELRTLTGHTDFVRSVAFSPDGKTVASGGRDQTVKLWETDTGRVLRTLTGHSQMVLSVAFSPNGQMLASGGVDNQTRLWDVASGRLLHTLAGHTSPVRSVTFSANGEFLFSGSDDATIKLWRVNGVEPLASLIALDKTDWAVVSPKGQFDASPNAQKLMHWMVGNEPIDLEQLKERYYEPGLLAKLMGFNKEPLRDVSALGNVELFPSMNYAEPDGTGKLKLQLSNRGGGIGKVRVLVNGKEIAADARGPSPAPEATEAHLTVDLTGASIIPGQENTVEVIAWNAEGYLSSRGVKIVWKPTGAEDGAARHPDLYAIVVGISKYAGGSFDLTFAAKDAEDMAQALKVGAKGLFGVEKTHITLLNTSGKEGVSLPTKENIRKAFDSVAKQAKPWDVLMIYLSGHGVALSGAEDIYLYPTQEARALDSETLKDSALRQATTISSEELTDWLTKTEWVAGQKGLAPLKRVIVLDTCAAGKLAEKLTRDPGSLSSAQIRAIDRLKDRTGYHVLMGSAADAVSYEASRYGQGLLTYSLLQGMRGAALREDQYVDVALLFQHAADSVPQLARNIGGIQRPIIAAPQGVSFDVGLLKTKEEKLAIPLAQLKPILLRPVLINRDETVGFDDLELAPLLRERLQNESETKARGGTGSWISVYVNADEMPGAVRPSGTYVVTEDVVRITINLIQDGKKIDSFQVVGSKSDKEALVLKISEGISGLMKKHEPELVTSAQ
jgi:WD40 repeat protein/uncharacterized caspase-like protein